MDGHQPTTRSLLAGHPEMRCSLDQEDWPCAYVRRRRKERWVHYAVFWYRKRVRDPDLRDFTYRERLYEAATFIYGLLAFAGLPLEVEEVC